MDQVGTLADIARMSLFVALLRGVNVGGRGKVAMAELKALTAELGYDEPRTLLQSGNLVFGAKAAKPDALEAKLHKAITDRFGINTELFVRTPKEWAELVEANPFSAFAAKDPARMLAWVMKAPPTKASVDALRAANPGPESMEARGRTLYITFPQGQGTSKLPALIDRHMPGRGTGRNWNTVLKLLEMVA
jgi:uncharacterized protein (DUF1697 family)